MWEKKKNDAPGGGTGEEPGENTPRKKKQILGSEGELIYILTKAGHVVILNMLWLVSCIPVFTIGTATTSLYYAMMKNIRRNRSYPTTEYFASFRRTFAGGSVFTLILAVWLFVLYHLRTIALVQGGETGTFLSRMYLAIMAVTAGIAVYLFPVLSRFTMKLSSMAKLAFVMAVRYLGFTVLIVAGTALLVWLWIYYLPIPTILFLPGAWCYVCTFMIEKALRAYMPKPDGDEDAWYFE